MRSLLLLAALAACTSGPADRQNGARTPLSAACDVLDDTRCLLPWPSSTYTVADPSTPTGLRVAVIRSSLPQLDDPAPLNRLDGFSVATALAVGFPEAIDASLSGQKLTTAARLFDAVGREVPLRLFVVPDGTSDASLLFAYPMHPLAYGTDYVAVILDDVRPAAGGAFVAPHNVEVALKRTDAETDEELALAAYHAPTRAVLERAGVDPGRVLRVWDFTTRSAISVTEPMARMRAQALATVEARSLDVVLDSAVLRTAGGLEVHGRVGGLPKFLTDASLLALDAEGLPVATAID